MSRLGEREGVAVPPEGLEDEHRDSASFDRNDDDLESIRSSLSEHVENTVWTGPCLYLVYPLSGPSSIVHLQRPDVMLPINDDLDVELLAQHLITYGIRHVRNAEVHLRDLSNAQLANLFEKLGKRNALLDTTLQCSLGPNVETLTLQSCYALRKSTLYAIAKTCPNLHYVDFTGCPQVDNKIVEQLLLHCKKLHTLVLDDARRVTDAAFRRVDPRQQQRGRARERLLSGGGSISVNGCGSAAAAPTPGTSSSSSGSSARAAAAVPVLETPTCASSIPPVPSAKSKAHVDSSAATEREKVRRLRDFLAGRDDHVVPAPRRDISTNRKKPSASGRATSLRQPRCKSLAVNIGSTSKVASADGKPLGHDGSSFALSSLDAVKSGAKNTLRHQVSDSGASSPSTILVGTSPSTSSGSSSCVKKAASALPNAGCRSGELHAHRRFHSVPKGFKKSSVEAAENVTPENIPVSTPSHLVFGSKDTREEENKRNMSSSLHKSVGAETTSTVPSTPRLPLLTPTRTLSVAAAFTTPDVSQSKTTARTPETELHQLLDEKFPKSLSLNATPTTRVDVPTSSSSSTHLREQEQHHTVTVPPPPTPLTLQLQLESTSTGLANLRELSLCRNSQMSALGVQHILRRAKKLRSIKLSQCNLRLTENILCLIFGQKKLPYLQIVDLSFLQGPIENFEYLQPGNVLRELNLGRTNLTNAGVQRIRKLCVHLEKLFLPWCREISDGAFVDVEEPAVLENSSSAAASVVNSNGVVNEQHTSAGAEVQVSSNNKDSIPNKVVSELPRLRMLDLCGTQIGDLTLQKFVFSKLIRLQELDISWCGMVKLNGIHFSDAVFAKRRVGSSSTSGVSSRSRALALANKKQDATSKMANNAVGQEDATNVEAVAQRPEMGCDVTSVPMPAHTSSEVSAAKKEVEVADLPLPPFDLVGDINNNNESGKESVFPDKSSAPVEHIGVDVDLPPLDLVGEISNESSKESVFPAQPTDSTDQDGRESVYTTLSSQLSQGDPTELEYNNFHCCSTPFSMSSSCYNNDVGKATSSSTMRGPDHSPGGSTTSRSINSATVFNLTADNRARRGSIDFIKDRAANLAPATQRARSRGSSREQTPPVAHSGRGAASGTTSSCSPSSRKGERGGAASVQRADRVVTFQSEGRDVVVSSERRTAQASAPISANSTAINAIGGGSGSTKTLVRQDSSITPRLAVPTNNGANSSSTTSNSAAPKRGLTALHLTGLWNLERVIAADPARTLGLSRSLQTLRLDNIEIGPSVLHALAANCPSLQNLGLQIRPFLCEMIAEEQIVSSCSSSTAAAENPPSSAAENPFLVLSQTCQQLEVLAVDCEQPSIVVDALATGFPRLKALRLRCPLFDNDLSRILAAKTVHLEQLDLADVNLADDTLRRWMEDAEDEEEEDEVELPIPNPHFFYFALQKTRRSGDSGSAGGSGRAVYRRSMDISEQDLLKHDDEDSSADAGLDEEDEDDHHADCPSEPAQNERRLHEQVRGTLANLLTFHARAHQLTDTGANCLANMLVSALTVELDSPFLSKGALSHFLRQEQLQFLRRVQITAGAEGGGTGGGASKKHVWSGDKKRDSEKRLRERNMLAVLQEGGSEMEMSD